MKLIYLLIIHSEFDNSLERRKLKTRIENGPELITEDKYLPQPSSGAYEEKSNRKKRLASTCLEIINDDEGPPLSPGSLGGSGEKSNFRTP